MDQINKWLGGVLHCHLATEQLDAVVQDSLFNLFISQRVYKFFQIEIERAAKRGNMTRCRDEKFVILSCPKFPWNAPYAK